MVPKKVVWPGYSTKIWGLFVTSGAYLKPRRFSFEHFQYTQTRAALLPQGDEAQFVLVPWEPNGGPPSFAALKSQHKQTTGCTHFRAGRGMGDPLALSAGPMDGMHQWDSCEIGQLPITSQEGIV